MSKHPNLIYVFPDEFRAQCFCGGDPVITPTFEKFARESVVFNRAVSNNPVCSPYRAIMMTGKYPHKNGVYTNCHSESKKDGCYLKTGEQCLSDVLAGNGYQCGYIGKWHMDPPDEGHIAYTEGYRGDGLIWDAYTPAERRHGFSFWHSYGCCDNHLHPHYWETGDKLEDRRDIGEWSVKHETDTAVEYIRNAPLDKPFALFLAHNPPHMPFNEVPEQYQAIYRDTPAEKLLTRPNVQLTEDAVKSVKGYFAAVSGLDDQFSRVLQAVEEKGIADNTIIIYTSDHGEMMGSHGMMYKNTYYQEAFQVPFILRYPDRLKPRKTDMLFSTVDIMPTLLTLMGLEDNIPDGCQGGNVGDALLENRDGDIQRCLYTHHVLERRGFMDKQYTFVMKHVEDDLSMPYEAVLFDNAADPYQMRDLAKEGNQELIRRLKGDLEALLEQIGDPVLEKIRQADL